MSHLSTKFDEAVNEGLSELPELTKDELPTNAWLVYSSIKETADDYRVPVSSHYGRAGYTQSVSIYHVCRVLWPKMAVLGRGNARVRATHKHIVRYLLDTGNLAIVEKGNKQRMSKWWVPLEWQDRPASAEVSLADELVESVEEPDAVADLTFEEKQAKSVVAECPLCHRLCKDLAGMVKHALSQHVDLNEVLVTYMRKHKGEHVHVSVIREDVRQLTKLPLSNLCVSTHLRALSDEELSGIRRTDTMGYYEYEATHTCREPGCGVKYPYRWQLLEHEDTEHENSPHRSHVCPECGGRFYNQRGLQTHTRMTHGDRSVTVDKETDVPPTTAPAPVASTELEALASLIQSAQQNKAELDRLREGLTHVAGIVNELAVALNGLLNLSEA